jgi:hypothetical protein
VKAALGPLHELVEAMSLPDLREVVSARAMLEDLDALPAVVAAWELEPR